MKWVIAGSLLRVLALSHQGCRDLLHRWGPTGGHEVECNCVCGECEGPAQIGHPPPCTPPPPPPPMPPPPVLPPPATPPPPPALAKLEEIPTLEQEHLPTLSPEPVSPPKPSRFEPTPIPPPPPPPPPNGTNETNATLLRVMSTMRKSVGVRKPPALAGRLRFCVALLQQLPPPPAECQCECPPYNLRAPGPALCEPPKLPTTTPKPVPVVAPGTPAPKPVL